MRIELPRHAVIALKSLNTNKIFKTLAGDGKYVEILLKNAFSISALKIGTYDSLSKPKLLFIRGKEQLHEMYTLHKNEYYTYFCLFYLDLLMARLQVFKDGPSRLERFAELINTVCSKLRSK